MAPGEAGPVWLLVCALSIIAALGSYGFLQERIMAMPYGDGVYFKWSVFLVLNNRLVAALAGLIRAVLSGEAMNSGPPKWKYFCIAFSNIIATSCQYEALKYVSFPTQCLGKSMKMVPVMVMNKVVSGKTYQWRDWAISLVVTGGCALFMMAGSIASKRSKGKDDSIYGLLLLCVYLAFDALTPTLQERVFQKEKAPRGTAMFYTNLSSALTSVVYLTSTGLIPEVMDFVAKYPSVVFDATLLSLSATCGQFAIYSTIANFGSLILAAIMNVRMLVQVILSTVMYGHVMTPGQLGGLVLVFGALFTKVRMDFLKKATVDKTKKTK